MPGVEKTGQSGLQVGREFYRRRVAELETQLKTTPSTSWRWIELQEELELRRLQWIQLDRRAEFVNKSVL